MSFRPPRNLPVISILYVAYFVLITSYWRSNHYVQPRQLDLWTRCSHNASSPPSMKALSLLRKANTEPYPTAPQRPLSFELNISERPPTSDQLRTMQRYYGRPISTFLSAHPTSDGSQSGSGDEFERIVQNAEKNKMALKYPLVVDWDAGKIAVGDLADVQKILDARQKARDAGNDSNSSNSPGGAGGEKKGWFSGLFGGSWPGLWPWYIMHYAFNGWCMMRGCTWAYRPIDCNGKCYLPRILGSDPDPFTSWHSHSPKLVN